MSLGTKNVKASELDDPSALAHLVASTMRTIPVEERQKILETVDVEQRLRMISGILSRELEVFELGSKIQSQVQSEMEKGQLRVDANVSVRPAGSSELRTRCELKNMNSFRFVAQGIDAEVARQIAVYESGGEVVQETYDFDAGSGALTARRSKEEADDYRYFPEPDLVPVDPDPAWIEQIRAALPPMPAARREALAAATGTSLPDETVALIVERGQDAQASGAIEAGADPARVLVHVSQNLSVDGGADVDPGRLAAVAAEPARVAHWEARLAEVRALGRDLGQDRRS